MSFDLFARIKDIVAKAATINQQKLPVKRWDKVSINMRQTAIVTAHGVGFNAAHQSASVFWTFQDVADPTNVQTIIGLVNVHGDVTITLDDDASGPHLAVAENKARIAARPILQWTGVKLSIELIFDLDGVRQAYRFDGELV